MARPWSARCYGVARQRDGSRQNSTGVSGVLSLRHFSGWFSLSLGAWVPKNLARRSFGLLVSAARCCSTGSGRLDLDLLISGPRVNLVYQPYARGGADGQAVVCPLLRGSSPTRGVAPKQHRAPACFLSGIFRAGSLDPLARGCRRIWPARCCSTGSGRLDLDLWFRPARCCSTGSGRLDLDLLISGPRVNLIY